MQPRVKDFVCLIETPPRRTVAPCEISVSPTPSPIQQCALLGSRPGRLDDISSQNKVVLGFEDHASRMSPSRAGSLKQNLDTSGYKTNCANSELRAKRMSTQKPFREKTAELQDSLKSVEHISRRSLSQVGPHMQNLDASKTSSELRAKRMSTQNSFREIAELREPRKSIEQVSRRSLSQAGSHRQHLDADDKTSGEFRAKRMSTQNPVGKNIAEPQELRKTMDRVSRRSLSHAGSHRQHLDASKDKASGDVLPKRTSTDNPFCLPDLLDAKAAAVKAGSVAAEPVKVLGAGRGGIDELCTHLNDRMVAWALLRFQVGSGTFARIKFVVVQCNGADAPIMHRGLLKARGGEVLQLLGETHASMDLARVHELTTESVCQRLLPLFEADDLGCYSANALQEEYARMLATMQSEAAVPLKCEKRLVPKENKMSIVDALRAVGEDRGSCNWLLLDPSNRQLSGSGDGGLEEMKGCLQENKVLFGVLRLSFGHAGQESPRKGRKQASLVAPLTKYVFVHWVGSQVSIVQRGRLNAQLQWALGHVNSCCAIAFRREAFRLGDLTLEDLIEELKRRTGGALALRMSIAGHVASLQEEIWAKQERVPPPCSQPTKSEAKLLDVEDTISVVRAPSGNWNWVLCGWQPSPNPLVPKRGGC